MLLATVCSSIEIANQEIYILAMLKLDIGNRLVLRKNHACGSKEWEVWRLGMDVGIKCIKCGRKLKMVRSKLEKNVKEVISDR